MWQKWLNINQNLKLFFMKIGFPGSRAIVSRGKYNQHHEKRFARQRGSLSSKIVSALKTMIFFSYQKQGYR